MSGERPEERPSSCLHNLHRIGDGRTPRPEPTELCRNDLGVFHMADCPLAVGLPCAYFERAPEPHPTAGDLDLEAAHETMQRDFLGWRYRRRVRLLAKPRNLVPATITVEGAAEPEEVVPETLAMRAPPPSAASPPALPAEPAAESASPEPAAPAPAAAPERYPGQRRSEERLAKKRARLAARDAAAAARAARLAAEAAAAAAPVGSGAAPPGADDEDGDDAFGGDLVEDEAPEEEGPKTVEQVLAALPDAPLVMRQQGPREAGGGPPRRRRRRGRRGGGSGGAGRRPGDGRGPRPAPQGPAAR